MRRILTVLFVAALIVVARPPGAAALTADELRQDIIAGLRARLGPLTAIPVSFDEVRVQPREPGFRVEITGLVSVPEGEDAWAEIGDLAFSVEEAGEGLYRVADLSGLDEVRLRGPDGEQIGLLAFRWERFVGTWSSAFAGFLEADLLLRDLRFAFADGSLFLSIAGLGGINRAEDTGDGRYDLNGQGRATGLRAEIPGQGTVEVREIEVETTTRGLDLDAYGALTREWDALNRREAPLDEAEIAAFLEKMAAQDGLLPSEFAERFALTDLLVSDAAGRRVFVVDRAEWDVAGSALDQPLAEARLGARHRGLALGEDAAGMGVRRELVPGEAGFVITVERLPGRELWRALFNAMAVAARQGAAVQPGSGAGDMALMLLLGELGPAFGEAGTRIGLPHLRIVSEALEATAEGSAEVDPAAANGLTGALDVALVGLDRTLELLQSRAGPEAPDVQGALMALFWLKTMARRETDGEGRAVDRIAVELTAAGQVLLNGQPMGLPSLPQP